MCAILALLDLPADPTPADAASRRSQAIKLSRIQRHRGPDWSGIHVAERAILVHERLAIVGVQSGSQPLLSPDGRLALAVNGEIYNHRDLAQILADPYPLQTGSDCEVLLPLYQELGADFVPRLRGMFAFVLYDSDRDRYLIARDRFGIIPLYTGYDADGVFYVASEMKALVPVCDTITEFPPGHLLDSLEGRLRPWHQPAWRHYESVAEGPSDPALVRHALEDAVRSHLMSDVPHGVLLSGGLDSSIVAAVAQRFAARRIEDDGKTSAWWPRLHSFAIGLEGSPDLAAARQVADHIHTVHHELHFTIDEGLDALEDVIFHIETYDVTSIRASTPMFLMARMIKAMGIKMVLSGEGADEIFGGYLYFHKAPNPRAFHEETVRKLEALHQYDCLRANKSMAAWGVEARVPFLDGPFVDAAMALNPAAKMVGPGRIEKQILRDAFADLLPNAILTRQKEQFSDGVGYAWIDALKALAEQRVSDTELARAPLRFPIHPPTTKEAYLYRTIFAQHFPSASCAACVPGGPSVACSTPAALAWDPAFQQLADPSGRAVRSVHRDAYEG